MHKKLFPPPPPPLHSPLMHLYHHLFFGLIICTIPILNPDNLALTITKLEDPPFSASLDNVLVATGPPTPKPPQNKGDFCPAQNSIELDGGMAKGKPPPPPPPT